jgi:hypothetical protein
MKLCPQCHGLGQVLRQERSHLARIVCPTCQGRPARNPSFQRQAELYVLARSYREAWGISQDTADKLASIGFSVSEVEDLPIRGLAYGVGNEAALEIFAALGREVIEEIMLTPMELATLEFQEQAILQRK